MINYVSWHLLGGNRKKEVQLTCFMMAERASLAMSGFVSPLIASPTPDVESAVSGSILGSCQHTSRYHYISLTHSLAPAVKSLQRNGNCRGKSCRNRHENHPPYKMDVAGPLGGNIAEMSPNRTTRCHDDWTTPIMKRKTTTNSLTYIMLITAMVTHLL